MDADEREICIYLKSWSGVFISGREIARRAGGRRRFRDDPNWASPVIARLVEKKIIEDDAGGHYRLIPREKNKVKKWVSPQIKKILEQSGKTFDVGDLDDDELKDLEP
jgi:hypothetical protein